MKALNIWTYLLLIAGLVLYSIGIFSGEFHHFAWVFWGTSSLAIALLISSTFCVLLSVSLFLVAHAIRDAHEKD